MGLNSKVPRRKGTERDAFQTNEGRVRNKEGEGREDIEGLLEDLYFVLKKIR